MTRAEPSGHGPTETPTAGWSPRAARAIWAAAEPFTLWGLFRPEIATGLAASLAADHVDLWAAFVLARSAPLGKASPAVVVAAFRSMPAARVIATVADVWTTISPTDAMAITHDAVTQAGAVTFAESGLDRSAADVAALLEPVVAALDTTGRPLAAAGQAAPLPDEKWARVWRLLNTVREYRGDAHIAALVTNGIDRYEGEALMAAWAGDRLDVELLRQSRAIGEGEWQAAQSRLAERGVLDGHGSLTALGRQLREDIEDRTDVASAVPWQVLGHPNTEVVYEFAKAASTTLIEKGQMRAVTAVGAPWPPPQLP